MRAFLLAGAVAGLIAAPPHAKASIMLDGSLVDFGTVVVGSQVSAISVTLNYSLGPGQDSAFRASPASAIIDAFTVDATNCPGGFAGSGSCRIDVSLSDTSPGSFQGDSFTIQYNTIAQAGSSSQAYTAQLNLRANIVAATAVPEPASLALLGLGVAGVTAVRRRRAPWS